MNQIHDKCERERYTVQTGLVEEERNRNLLWGVLPGILLQAPFTCLGINLELRVEFPTL